MVMRPYPDPFEEYLYRRLINSKIFRDFVQAIYCRVNGIPTPKQSAANQLFHKPPTTANVADYVPTQMQKMTAIRKIFWQEFKKSITFK